uniref:Uncharacterized protein n=1 Tax=viral metagenome TaxID=1070528 RepID=A0A6M3K9C2_9ZZZZ
MKGFTPGKQPIKSITTSWRLPIEINLRLRLTTNERDRIRYILDTYNASTSGSSLSFIRHAVLHLLNCPEVDPGLKAAIKKANEIYPEIDEYSKKYNT